MDTEFLNIQMVIFIKDNFKWIKYVEEAFILIIMGQNMMDYGEMINKMDLALKHGKTALNLKAIILMVKNMERVNFNQNYNFHY